MTTLYDVARFAQVSPKTVSRVVNGSPEVATDTRQRVRAAIAELDYHPNDVAKGLRQRRSHTIGLVVPFGSDFVFRDPGMWEQIYGSHQALSEHGYDLVLSVPHSAHAVLRELTRLTRNKSVDGVILYAMEGVDGLIREFEQRKIRYVSLGMCYAAQRNNFVEVDSAHAGYIAARALLDRGSREIGVIAEPRSFLYPVKASVVSGFRRACGESDVPIREDLIVEGDYSIDSGYLGAKRLLAASPRLESLLCASDPMAWGALRAAAEANRHVGVDIDIIGGDDLPQTRHMVPGLTAIRTPLYELGYAAGRMIIEGIERGTDVPGRMFLGELIVRDSVRRPA